MPRTVDIALFPIARTCVDRAAVRHWLTHLGAIGVELPSPDAVTDPALLVALAAKRCYLSFEPGLNPNISKVREDLTLYLDNILRQGHGSVLEHSVYTFAIEGVSRVFTAEMNRHRAGWAISEGSLRFIRFDREIPYWLPTSLCENPEDDHDLAARKRQSRELFDQAFRQQEEVYGQLLAVWDMDDQHHNFAYKKKVTSCLRRIVGMGVATGGVWTGNLRALRHVIAMRSDPAAEEEIFHVFSRIGAMMIQAEPMIFQDASGSEVGGWQFQNWKV